MTELFSPTPTAPMAAWNANVETAVCKNCGWRFLVQTGQRSPTCPHCCKPSVEITPGEEGTASPCLPELVVPFTVTLQVLEKALKEFASGIPFPPDELNAETLWQRLAPVYLPMWLVDGHVYATWEAESGFDYDVISHQEYYDETRQWQTKEVKESRVRWEPRVGQLNRVYQNVALPAVDDAPSLEKQLGAFDPENAQPYTADFLMQEGRPVWVRLPDHDPQDAWTDITNEFQKTAAEDCQAACDANHIRQFRWKAEFNDLNWTLLLLPVYTSYYQDDDGRPQPLLIHGQTGKITGARVASMQRARQSGMTLLLLGLILAGVGVLAGLNGGINLLSVLLVVTGVITGMAAMTQSNRAWDFNHRQVMERASSFSHRK